MININCVRDVRLLHKIEHYQYRASGLAIGIGKISLIDYYGPTCKFRNSSEQYQAIWKWNYNFELEIVWIIGPVLCVSGWLCVLFGLYHVWLCVLLSQCCVGRYWTDCCATQVKSVEEAEEIFPPNIKLNHIWSNFSITGNTPLGFSHSRAAHCHSSGAHSHYLTSWPVHGTLWRTHGGIKNVDLPPPQIGISWNQSKLGCFLHCWLLFSCLCCGGVTYCDDVSDLIKL